MNTPVTFRAEQACAGCGRFGAYAFEGEFLCADCYQERGSCCAEAHCDPAEDDEPPRREPE
jgi:hypothetical protein